MYIEIFILEDLFLNYVILLSLGLLLNRITKIPKLILSASIGTINLIFLFLDIRQIYLFLISVLFSILMSLIAYGYKDILYTIKNVIYMYLISIFIGGFIYLININICPKLDNTSLSFIVLLISSPIISYIYLFSIREFKNNYANYYQVDIYFNELDKVTLAGFLDTGNKLIDPFFHKPIILVHAKYVPECIDKFIYVPCITVNNNSLLKCFNPYKIYIKGVGERKKLLIGIIDKVNIEGVDCILNSKLM